MAPDLRLYALLDPAVAGGRALTELARLIAGSATLVQLRDKRADTGALVEEARGLLAILKPAGVPLLINDRVDVALAAKADGVHIGQTDMTPQDARALLGPAAVIGLTVQNVAQAEAAPLELIDYVGIGGVYATASKDNTRPPIGPEGLARVTRAIRARKAHFPVCGIAGIAAGNAAAVIAAGADGIAVISALSLAPDPSQAARELRAAVDGALAKRGAA
jgi:thiamine-phosphate pyrophosphorylase